MNSLLEQVKKRRIALALKQHDMMLRVGISRQQYQRLESKGNPRLDTLELIVKGLKSELLLIPPRKAECYAGCIGRRGFVINRVINQARRAKKRVRL